LIRGQVLHFTLTQPVPNRVQALADRLKRWQVLQTKANADKRVAILYYNHPPGRQNVGAIIWTYRPHCLKC